MPSVVARHVKASAVPPCPLIQARVEIGLLQLLNTRCDPGDQHHIVRMVDFFLYRKHLCLVFEKLDVNLFELLRRNGFRCAAAAAPPCCKTKLPGW